MKSGKNFALVLVTSPDLKTARKIARTALEARLAACVNFLPKIESHYRWQGKITSSAEILMIFKTTRRHVVKLETFIIAHHPYDTPEFIVLPITAGSVRYLRWIEESVRA